MVQFLSHIWLVFCLQGLVAAEEGVAVQATTQSGFLNALIVVTDDYPYQCKCEPATDDDLATLDVTSEDMEPDLGVCVYDRGIVCKQLPGSSTRSHAMLAILLGLLVSPMRNI
uniref:Uncharacterized protein n=1 Tax=Noctiluca scintillans TaxID=2966 RepID=A0A7S1AI56_NOCSC|mmetsp:Transcript_47313/g.125578  ORF Transcript_47313/g.125578 Transcript_47313/m.125578 type:complete len:113 (+) Transcript_47313:99-437(+)